jgi:integrase
MAKEAAKRNEKPVRPFVLYDLRHTFLTRLGESGCDVWTLARIAGHRVTSIRMTISSSLQLSGWVGTKLGTPKMLLHPLRIEDS